MSRFGTNLEATIDSETVVLSRIDTAVSSTNEILWVKRENGNKVRLRLSSSVGIDINWRIGRKYRLENIELRRAAENRALHDTESTTITAVSDSLNLLFTGDTHIGYCHRDQSRHRKYSHKDEYDFFNRLIDQLSEGDYQSLIHTGDLLDHGVRQKGIKYVHRLASQLDSNKKIKFVTGNHDKEVSEAVSSLCEHPQVEQIEFEICTRAGYNIILADFSQFSELNDFHWREIEQQYGGPNILVAHPENVKQSELHLKDLQNELTEQWILFIGHRHKGRKYQFDNLTVIFTGCFIFRDKYPTVWNLEAGYGEYEITNPTT